MRVERVHRTTAFACAALLLSIPARAVAESLPAAASAIPATVTSAGPEPPESAAPNVAPDSEATRSFDEAEERWRKGDLPGAFAAMERSHAVSQRPELLFNLGQICNEMGRCACALHYYGRYVREAPNAAFHRDALDSVERLEQQCPPPKTKPAPTPQALRHAYWTAPRIAGWAAIGAGVATGAGAVYFALAAKRDEDRLESRFPTGDEPAPWTARAAELESEGRRAATWGRVLAVGASSLLVGGTLLVILGRPRSEQPAVSLQLERDRLAAGYALRF